jgi:DMSO reductase family type II enzyme molybdopterin subunit
MTSELTRRSFLEGSAAVLTLSMLQLRCGRESEPVSEIVTAAVPAVPPGAPEYREFEDLYRAQWTWDTVVKGAHHVVNCVSACPFNLFVKDGIVLREEQNAVMAATNSSYPDFNPRGCQKGICTSQLMYGPSRLKYPLKRVGPRGGGKWKRISWDDALTEIADKWLDVATEDGPECVIYDSGTANAGYGSEGAEMALMNKLGCTQLDGWACAGDMPLGVIMTWGLFNMDGTSDDYFNSDLIFLWLGNPSYTRIPDAHFLWEARYNGTKVVSVAPDYNASTMHCDQWVNLRVGTDAALALGMAHVIVSEGLYKGDYVVEQTDLPLLVREDDGKFLRQADLEKRGKDNVFYLWDRKQGKAVPAPGSEGLGRGTKLRLDELDPALDGSFEVTLANGDTVRVRTVFERLRERLADYTPEAAAAITGLDAQEIAELGREFARANAVSIFGSWGIMKHHHSDLFQRGMILLLALTGNVGKRGAGLKIGAWYMMSGLEDVMAEHPPSWWQKALMKVFKPTVREVFKYTKKYEDDYMYMNTPALLFLYQHGGLDQAVDDPSYHDANPGIPLKEAIKQALQEGWFPDYPGNGKKPRMYIHTRINPLRRWPAPQLAKEHLWPQCELIVGLNIQMSTTCAMSDIVLPNCLYYERRGIKYAQSYVPYYVRPRAGNPIRPRREGQPDRVLEDVREVDEEGAFRSRGRPALLRDRHPGITRDRQDSLAGGRFEGRRSHPGHRPVPDPHQYLQRLRAGRDRLLGPVVHREEGAVAHADGPNAVLPGPRLVPGGRRAPAHSQGDAAGGRRLPASSHRRASALVDPFDLLDGATHAPAPAG